MLDIINKLWITVSVLSFVATGLSVLCGCLAEDDEDIKESDKDKFRNIFGISITIFILSSIFGLIFTIWTR